MKWNYIGKDPLPELNRKLLVDLNKETMVWASIEIATREECDQCDCVHWRFWGRDKLDDAVTRWIYLDDVLKEIKD